MKRLMLVLVVGLLASSVQAQDSVEFEAKQVAKGLTMLSGVGGFSGGNILISTGADGTIMIDDSMPPLAEKLQAKIKEVAGGDVDYLINTHLHGDHTGNNATFAATGTHIIGHKNVRERMSADSKLSADSLPVITFSDEMSFYLNAQPARIMHVAKAHTDGDSVIYFTEANVIHTGDTLFNGMFPFVDLDNGGSVQGYLDAQQKIIDLADQDTVIVPGHGPLGKVEDVTAARDMLAESRRRIADLIKQGKTIEDIVAMNPLADYHEQWNWGFITTEKMTRTLFRDLQKYGEDPHSSHHHSH
ncbi:MBL fold metallo-hydrolase [Gilvimarinus sp. SDUM040013]|uniref:MBL fold metallo-hydrolase n=1 Tax=Gilvimarinus gilvus TaxID=3058038 RepID=A0ABU4RSX7_9GAMM|nr:MBL fold metallo-hydrolase [Gilvimarinus sp. SDUM040013]MDO3387111.1 MBL fold metallo-hydrolase [Gilvimarinus sp. SDUM040013]MDX6847994.1 MBL fold metallo-hydrolase [Gilvimarinus sp. SDUM040013]